MTAIAENLNVSRPFCLRVQPRVGCRSESWARRPGDAAGSRSML